MPRARSDLARSLAALRAHPLSGAAMRWASRLLVSACAVFLAVMVQRHWAAVSRISLSPGQWTTLATLALVYGAALFLLALAWHHVLLMVGAGPVSAAHSAKAYSTAQLAKYVPGNVFHFVGRHMIHRAEGMDDKRLVVATLVENVLLLLAAACVAVVCLAVGGEDRLRMLALIAGAALLAGVPAAVIVMRRKFTFPILPGLIALGAGVAFFAVMAAIIVAIAAMLGAPPAWDIGAGGIVSWIAGFVTPGAPGGLGVREAAMVFIGGRGTGPDVLLLLAVLFRLVTFAGDVLCALLGRVLLRG